MIIKISKQTSLKMTVQNKRNKKGLMLLYCVFKGVLNVVQWYLTKFALTKWTFKEKTA